MIEENDILKQYNTFFDFLRENYSERTLQDTQKAALIAQEIIKNEKRYNGRPMLEHDISVAMIVGREIGLGRNSMVSSILHDAVRVTLRDNGAEKIPELLEKIKTLFGEEVEGILSGLTNISELKLNMEPSQAESFREMIVSYSEDPRVILIKLADRLEVMRSIEIFPKEKRIRKSWESMNLYAQIAHKLGLYNIKSELEDLSLSQLEPKSYNEIKTKLAASEHERKAFIEKFTEPIEAELRKAGIKYHLKSRTKSIYSIWNKMRKQNVPFEGVFDIFAIRLILDCAPEQEKLQCWTVYSIVSDIYTPNTERMRDWITIPKSNGYESLHTTVSAGEGKWVEIQIRTERMDSVAELGIAAHWRYKGVKNGSKTSDMWLSKLRELMSETTTDIAERFDAKPLSSELFVFTPNGDIRKLPEGATILDFAFDIHSNLGCTCTGGRVNAKAVPIREPLHNGDIIEIITNKNQTPKADWLNYVVTSKAKNKIKAVLREEQAKNAKEGREELERKIKSWKITRTIDEVVAYLCKFYKQKSGIAIYEMIAIGKLDILSVRDVLFRWISGEADAERRAAEAEAERKRTSSMPEQSSDALIIDEGLDNIVYKLAKCCNPIKGDDVFGFVTISTGITIHRSDCPNAKRMKAMYPYRIMAARWRKNSTGSFRVTLRVIAVDKAGIAASLTDTISRDMKLNMKGLNITSRSDGTIEGVISVEVPSAGVVDTLIHAILRIKGVQKAYRVNTKTSEL